MRVDFVSRGVFRNRFDCEFVFRQSSVEAEPLTQSTMSQIDHDYIVYEKYHPNYVPCRQPGVEGVDEAPARALGERIYSNSTVASTVATTLATTTSVPLRG